MNKLTNSKLRRLIMQELARVVGEDALVTKAGKEKNKHIHTHFRSRLQLKGVGFQPFFRYC